MTAAYHSTKLKMTDLLIVFRRKTDGLCASPSDCAEASSMITELNNISLDEASSTS
jgi:hypothetical protein